VSAVPRPLDVRLPIGLMFTTFGLLLTIFGLVSDRAMYRERSLGIDINLDWGLVLLVFGVTMLVFALRARAAVRQGEETRPIRG
jgi:hypothetical protein